MGQENLSKNQNRRLKRTIHNIRLGKPDAVAKLISLYNPLIYKTCSILYKRYGGLVPMEELISNGRHLLIYLTLMEYKPGGKAHYPRFIEKYLHARLVQLCRPIVNYRKRAVPLDENIEDNNMPSMRICNKERNNIVRRINHFMYKTFNERELDIVLNHIINGYSRNELARKYGVSNNRMKMIQFRCMEKLKRILLKFGITSMQDI